MIKTGVSTERSNYPSGPRGLTAKVGEPGFPLMNRLKPFKFFAFYADTTKVGNILGSLTININKFRCRSGFHGIGALVPTYLVPKMTHAGECHGDAGLVGGGYDFLISD